MIAKESTQESQSGFRSNRGTADMIFMQRQIQEKCREKNIGLYAAFINLTKAFDTVSHDGLWKSFPKNFPGQQDQVKHNGSLPGSFPIPSSVKQGCALTFFSIFFSIMHSEAKEDLPDGIYICFQTDSSLFNLWCLLTHAKTIQELITELLFADDCTLLATWGKPYSTSSTASLMQP